MWVVVPLPRGLPMQFPNASCAACTWSRLDILGKSSVFTLWPISARCGSGMAHKHDDGPCAALLDKVCALNVLPRIGALRTLDL